jgi:hypothetical protein
MPRYATVTFRGKQMRVTYDPSPSALASLGPSAEVEWWFADLTAREREQLYVTPREEVAILRQIRGGHVGTSREPAFSGGRERQ